jgi:hypothetical protein
MSFFIRKTTYIVVIIHDLKDLSIGFLNIFLNAFPASETGRNLLF